MNTVKRRILEVILTGVILVAPAQVLAEEPIALYVNGTPVKYSWKSYSKEFLETIYGPMTSADYEQRVVRENIVRLAALVREEIIEQEIRSKGIVVGEDEIKSRLDEIQGSISENALAEIQQQMTAQVTALREVVKSTGNSQKIYEKYLKSTMPFPVWETFRQSYSTEDAISSLERNIPKSKENLSEQSHEAIRLELAKSKLELSLVKDLSVKDQDVRSAYEKMYEDTKKPPFEQVENEIRNQLLNDLKEKFIAHWWNELFVQAKIKVLNPTYKDVKELL